MTTQSLKYPSRGMQYSVLLHTGLLALVILGLPKFLAHEHDSTSVPVWVELVQPASVTHVTSQQPASAHTVPHRNPPAQPVHAPSVTHAAAPAAQPHGEVKPAIQPVRQAVQPPPTFEETMHRLDGAAPHTAVAPAPATAPSAPSAAIATSAPSDSAPLSLSEEDAIRTQIRQYWNMDAGAKGADNLVVTLHLKLGADGTVLLVEHTGDESRYMSDSYYRAAVESAIRAVKRSSPLKGLPPEKFGTWNDIEMTFNPKDMLN